MKFHVAVVSFLVLTASLAIGQDKPVDVTVLDMGPSPNWKWHPGGTLWRYHETWRTELCRLASGKLVRVDPLEPRVGFSGAAIWQEQKSGRDAKDLTFPVKGTTDLTGSAFAPGGWSAVDFDDRSWVRTATPMDCNYRSLAQVCLRGKFEVTDPAAVTSLTLHAVIKGGAVFYLNGKEAGRAFLPAGAIDPETPAQDYPRDAFVAPGGTLLNQTTHPSRVMGEEEYVFRVKDAELQRRYKLRFRAVDLDIPPAMLRKGTNVLAIEVHRAPADEVMFTTVHTKAMGYNLVDHRNFWWNRASLQDLTLKATARAGAVVANAERPAGIQLWNWPAWERVEPALYGDPNEPMTAVRMCAPRNGAASGQVVVSSDAPITNLKAVAGALTTKDGRKLPASALVIRYPVYYDRSRRVGFEALEAAAPEKIDLMSDDRGRPLKVVLQPVWLTVEVPAGAAAGDYEATLTVSADGLDPVTVPVSLHVSDYALPETREFTTHMGFVQSPDTLAIRYNVPMWSPEHWKLIERSFAILGRLATKELTIPLVRKTHFGNEHAMLWWTKKAGGSFEPDLHLVEKYIDVAVKHLGKIPVVIFYISEGEDGKTIPWITGFDPATGELSEDRGPRWGTEEARKFWRPAFDGFRKILAKHGMEKSLALGYHAAGGNGPVCAKQCIDDLAELVPEARWVRLGHFWFRGIDHLEKGPNGNPWARVGLVGNYGVYWVPGKDKPFYGWQNPYVVTAYTRGVFDESTALRDYRLCAEAILLTGQREAPAGWGICDFAGLFGRDTFLGMRGFAPWGGDFWPVLGRAGRWRDVIGRYNDPSAAHWDPRSSWSTVALNNFQVSYIIGEGEDGPVSTVRAEVLHEGLQEAEARVFVQNALLDEKMRAKLGGDLARRADAVCNERTEAFRHLSEYSIGGSGKAGWKVHYIFTPSAWQDRSQVLYDVAAEVRKALGK